MYIFQLVDNYCATIAAMIIGLTEITAIAWVYGMDRFMNNIKEMLGYYPFPRLYWKIIWQFVCPALIFVSFT
jgi:SNF family Na+-dependent transporter